MAAFDFPPNAVDPNPPEVGDTYKPPGSDITYQWNGTVWNASVGQSSVGVTLVTGGDGIDTSPVAGITETGNVAVDSTVVRTTGAQIINGNKTFPDGIYGNIYGGTSSYTSLADGSGTALGSITAINDTKLTIATTAGAFGAQLVTPDDQYVEVVSGATAYARFNAADTSFRVGGTLATAPNITLNADGSATFKELVSAGSGQYTNVCFSGTNRGDVPAGDNAVFFGQTANASGIIFGGGISGVGDTYNFTLLADGSAQFDGTVTSGTIDNSTNYAYLDNGRLQVNRTDDAAALLVAKNGSAAITLNADGSAEFSGVVYSGGNAFNGQADGSRLSPGGNIYASAGSGTLWGGYTTGSNLFTSRIDADGSATFNKSVSIGDTNAGTISATNLDAARAYELPNAGGTLALVSDITGGAVEFVGDIDVVADTAPTTPTGGIWVNTTAGNADSSFTGLNQQYIALNQLIFLTDNNGWVAGGVTDPATYVTIATNQTISGTKSFTQDIGIGGTLPASPNISLDNDGSAEFAGNVRSDDSFSLVNAAGAFRSFSDSAGVRFACSNNAGDVNTFEVNNDGSATFSGQVNVGNTSPTVDSNEGGSILYASSGGMRIFRSFDNNTTSAAAFDIFNNDTNVARINTDGSASFDGTVDAAALSDGTTTKTMTEVLNPPPSVPSGSVFYFAAATAPSGYLQCDGSAVSRTTYADLFAICSTTFGAGDGTSTFNLPDLRGEFIRGFDGGRDVDSGRAFGSTQDSAVDPGDIQVNDPGHSHGASGSGQYPLWATGPAKVTPAPTGQGYRQGSGINVTVNPANTGITIGNPASDADETRPRNVALLPCIKT